MYFGSFLTPKKLRTAALRALHVLRLRFMCFYVTINGKMNLQQSGGTSQCSLKFIIIVKLCALGHEVV